MLQVKIEKRKKRKRKEYPQCLIVCGFKVSMGRHSARIINLASHVAFSQPERWMSPTQIWRQVWEPWYTSNDEQLIGQLSEVNNSDDSDMANQQLSSDYSHELDLILTCLKFKLSGRQLPVLLLALLVLLLLAQVLARAARVQHQSEAQILTCLVLWLVISAWRSTGNTQACDNVFGCLWLGVWLFMSWQAPNAKYWIFFANLEIWSAEPTWACKLHDRRINCEVEQPILYPWVYTTKTSRKRWQRMLLQWFFSQGLQLVYF